MALSHQSLYISKDKSSVFSQLNIPSSILSTKLLKTWVDSKFTINKWKELFEAAKTSHSEMGNIQQVDDTNLNATEDFISKSLCYTTPKSKRKYKTLFEHHILQKMEVPNPGEAQVADLVGFKNELDKRISTYHTLLGTLWDTVAEEALVNDEHSKSSEVKFRRLNAEIG